MLFSFMVIHKKTTRCVPKVSEFSLKLCKVIIMNFYLQSFEIHSFQKNTMLTTALKNSAESLPLKLSKWLQSKPGYPK